MKRFKGQSLALGKKYDRSPDDVGSTDYDATMELMTADGTDDLETQKSDIEIGRRALGIQKEVAPQQYLIFARSERFTKNCEKQDGTGR